MSAARPAPARAVAAPVRNAVGMPARSISTPPRAVPHAIPTVMVANDHVNDSTAMLAVTARWTAARLFHPSTVLLAGTNLIPVIGLLFWSWDAFLVLLAYAMETAVVAFWTMLRITLRPE